LVSRAVSINKKGDDHRAKALVSLKE